MARLAENERDAARAERWARKEADQARDVARVQEKEAIAARARQAGPERVVPAGGRAAARPGDRGRPQRRAGPGVAFVPQALKPSRRRPPSGPARTRDPGEPVRLGRDRAGPGAHFLGRAPIPGFAFTPDGEVIAMASGRTRSSSSGPTPADRRATAEDPVRPEGGRMPFAPDGQSLWVASPGVSKVVDRTSLHRLDPERAARSSRRFPSMARSTTSSSTLWSPRRTVGTSWEPSKGCTRTIVDLGRIPPDRAGGESRLSRSGRPTRAGWFARWT